MGKRIVLMLVLVAVSTASVLAQTTDFLEAVKAGTLQDVQACIAGGADVNRRDWAGSTPLMWACYLQRFEVVTALLKAGADVNAQDSTWGYTALMWAAMYYEVPAEMIRLLDAGGNVKVKDKKGKTALDYAKENWRFEGTEAYRRLQEASKQL